MSDSQRPMPQTMVMQSQAAPSSGTQPSSMGSPPAGPPPGWPTPAPAATSKQGAGLGVLLVGLGCGGFALLVLMAGVMAGVWFMVDQDDAAPVATAPSAWAPPPQPMPIDAHAGARFRVPVLATTPVRGPDTALVTIVEIGEFQCPFCARASGVLTQLQAEYPGTVRVAWRHNPLPMHAQAQPAAVLAQEAYAQGGDASFWRMHDSLLENQTLLSALTLRALAIQNGLDTAGYDRALAGGTHDATIAADQALAAQLGARGTPTFFINGRLLSGAQPIERFREIVREELTYAQSVRDAGVPASQVYDRIIEHGRVSPAPTPAAAAAPRPNRPDPEVVRVVPVLDSPQLGPDDALVTLVVFSDFQCPFCARVVPTLQQIRERYGDDVRVVFKHNPLPFHSRADAAAEAAIEVHAQLGDAAFFQMHDALFGNQRALEDADLVRHAAQAGASRGRVQAALDGNRHRDVIARDQALAAELGARGTPSFFINGHVLTGAQPLSAFTARIDTELSEARALVAAGTPRASVYEAATAR